MDPAISILQKAPPADLAKNKKALTALDNSDAVDKRFPLPFIVIDSSEIGEKPFLACRYNQVANDNKYRSPWTHIVRSIDGISDEVIKSNENNNNNNNSDNDEQLELLQQLQEQMNQVWDGYKNLYYGHEAVGSVYLSKFEKNGGAFQGVFGIQKTCASGSWDSLHHVQVDSVNVAAKTCVYHVQSTVLSVINVNNNNSNNNNKCTISALLSKETSKSCKIRTVTTNASHMENIGALVEANEIDLRSSIERAHVPKTQEIVEHLKKTEPKRQSQVNPLMGMMMGSDVFKKRMAKNTATEE